MEIIHSFFCWVNTKYWVPIRIFYTFIDSDKTFKLPNNRLTNTYFGGKLDTAPVIHVCWKY